MIPDPFADALIAARLCAIDPALGGLIVRGGAVLHDELIATLRDGLPPGAPLRRMPSHIDDERLLGGLDLTATLALGRAVSRSGLLAEADGGAVIVPMAERLPDAVAGRIAAVLDSGELVTERDGTTQRHPARFVVIALDDGIDAEERPPASLAERLAFAIDLTGADPRRQAATAPRDAGPVDPVPDDQSIETLAGIAAALGIDTARAPLFALRAARARAQLAGRAAMTHDDLAFAARLVLVPRATRLPAAAPDAEPEPETPDTPPPEQDQGDADEERSDPGPVEDLVLAAVMATLPPDVLARIAGGGRRRNARGPSQRGAGERRKSGQRGRPKGAVAGIPGGGRRLSVIDTLRAAAPWQRLRTGPGKVHVRRDDLRVRRFETRSEVVTIFAVDASGSAAVARLAEAKGAVERLLADAYVKRAHVALVAFRGTGAELLLPPTRSLTRARRMLADLPGGGGTPLAAGLNAALDLAEAARARGRTPFLIVLTDGRANIAADGRAVRSQAESDALDAAKAIALAGIPGAFIDTSARPRAEGAAIATAMGARYLPLPRADSAAIGAPRWDREGRDWPNRAASRFVQAGGLRWHVQIMGPEAAPAVLLLHGTGAATHSWRDLAPVLAAGFRIVAPDLPGHGFTTGRPAGGLTMVAMARATGDLLQALAIDPVLITGHSAGAAIAIRMVIDGRASPRALVGLGAALLPIPGLAGVLFPSLARLVFVNPLAPHLFARMARTPGETARFLGRSTGSRIDARGIACYEALFATPGHCAGAVGMMAAWDLATLRRDMVREAALPGLSAGGKLAGLPLLLIHGASDAAIAPRHAHEAAKLTKARLVVLPGLGHLAHEEQPGEVAGLITRFAAEVIA
eukprot:gene14349-14473_t